MSAEFRQRHMRVIELNENDVASQIHCTLPDSYWNTVTTSRRRHWYGWPWRTSLLQKT